MRGLRGRAIIFPLMAGNWAAARQFGAALDRFARLRRGRVRVRRTLLWCEEHQRRHWTRFWDVTVTGTPGVQRWVYRYGVRPALSLTEEDAA